jgi:acyl-CoA hydrolase
MKQPKQVSAEQAAAVVRSGDWLDYGFGMGQPDRFDGALAARAGELRGVKIRACRTASRSSGSTGTSRATTAASTTPAAAPTSR